MAAWNVDFVAKVAAFSDIEVYEEFGVAMDEAADDSGCCDNDLCAAYGMSPPEPHPA